MCKLCPKVVVGQMEGGCTWGCLPRIDRSLAASNTMPAYDSWDKVGLAGSSFLDTYPCMSKVCKEAGIKVESTECGKYLRKEGKDGQKKCTAEAAKSLPIPTDVPQHDFLASILDPISSSAP